MKTFGAAAIAAILVGAGLAAPAAARPGSYGAPAVDISGDAATAYAAIVAAARAFCREQAIPGVHSDAAVAQCVEDTVSQAVADSGRRDLVAYHRARMSLADANSGK